MPRHDMIGTKCGKRWEKFWVSIAQMNDELDLGFCSMCGDINCQMEIDYSNWQSCGIQANLSNPIVYFKNRQGHIIPATDVNEPAPIGYFREDAHTLHDAQVLERQIQQQEDVLAKQRFEQADATRIYTNQLERKAADEDISRTLGNSASNISTAGTQFVKDFITEKRNERHAKQKRTLGTINAKLNILHEDSSTTKKRIAEGKASSHN